MSKWLKKPGSAGCQEPQEGSQGFLEPGELILEEHCGNHPCIESLLVHLRAEWNGSPEDPPEFEPPGVDLL